MSYRLFIVTLEEKLRLTNVSGVEQDVIFRSLLDGWEQGPFDEYWLWICEEGSRGSGQLRFNHVVQSILEEHTRHNWPVPKIQNRVFTHASFRSFELCRSEVSKILEEWVVPEGTRTTVLFTAPFPGINLGILFPFHDGHPIGELPESQKNLTLRYLGSEGVIHANLPRLSLDVNTREEFLETMDRVSLLGGIANASGLVSRPSDMGIRFAEDAARTAITTGDDWDNTGSAAYVTLLKAALAIFLEGFNLMRDGAYLPAKERLEEAARLTELLPEIVARKMEPVSPVWLVFFGSRYLAFLCDWATYEGEYSEYRYRVMRVCSLAMEASRLLGPYGPGNAIDLARRAIVEMRAANILATIGAFDENSKKSGRPRLFPDRKEDDPDFMPPGRIEEPILSGNRTILEFADDSDEDWTIHDVLQCCQFLGVWLLDETRASSFTVVPCAPEFTPSRTPFDTMPGGTEWMQHLAFLSLAEGLI